MPNQTQAQAGIHHPASEQWLDTELCVCAGQAIARGPWSISAVRSTKGAAVEETFVPTDLDTHPDVLKCSEAFDAPQSVREGSTVAWSTFPAPLQLDLNISSTSQSVLILVDLGRIQVCCANMICLAIAVRQVFRRLPQVS
eukprot:883053-Rhodomonas_salina.8